MKLIVSPWGGMIWLGSWEIRSRTSCTITQSNGHSKLIWSSSTWLMSRSRRYCFRLVTSKSKRETHLSTSVTPSSSCCKGNCHSEDRSSRRATSTTPYCKARGKRCKRRWLQLKIRFWRKSRASSCSNASEVSLSRWYLGTRSRVPLTKTSTSSRTLTCRIWSWRSCIS